MLILINLKTLIKEDRNNKDSIKDFKKDYPDEIEKLEEASLKNRGENDVKILKTELPDQNWKNSTKKLANPYEYSNSIVDYQKPFNNLQNENFLSKLKNKYPSDEEIK